MTKTKSSLPYSFNSTCSLASYHSHSLIADSACDQMLITSAWSIISRSGTFVTMTGAFAGRNVGETFPVVTAKCILRDASGNLYQAIAHDALYDSNALQKEALLSIHQSLRTPGNGIDDRSMSENDIHGRPGTQCSKFGSHVLPFFFDGRKCFYDVVRYDPSKHDGLPTVILSSPASSSSALRVHS